MAITTVTATAPSAIVVLGTTVSYPKLAKVVPGTPLPRPVLAVEASSRRVPTTPRTLAPKAGERCKEEKTHLLVFVAQQAKEADELATRVKLPKRLHEQQKDAIALLFQLVFYKVQKGAEEQQQQKVRHVLNFTLASRTIAKLCCAVPSNRRFPTPPPPPSVVLCKFPKVFFYDGSAVTRDIRAAGKDEAKMAAAVEEDMAELKGAVLYQTASAVM